MEESADDFMVESGDDDLDNYSESSSQSSTEDMIYGKRNSPTRAPAAAAATTADSQLTPGRTVRGSVDIGVKRAMLEENDEDSFSDEDSVDTPDIHNDDRSDDENDDDDDDDDDNDNDDSDDDSTGYDGEAKKEGSASGEQTPSVATELSASASAGSLPSMPSPRTNPAISLGTDVYALKCC
jgi:hypothetical protein